MSPKLPVIKARELVSALEKSGYQIKRQTGSHIILFNPGERQILTVPVHSGDVPPGTLRAIIRQAGMTVDELLRLL